jgi:hypothetical protein
LLLLYSKLEASSANAMLRFLLNVLWFVLGGFVMGLGWWLPLCQQS